MVLKMTLHGCITLKQAPSYLNIPALADAGLQHMGWPQVSEARLNYVYQQVSKEAL